MKKTKKNFDCVEMTRKIRDKIYEKYKHLSPEEFILKLSQEAKKSELWKIKNNNSG